MIDDLQTHPSQEVYEVAFRLIEDFFEEEENY